MYIYNIYLFHTQSIHIDKSYVNSNKRYTDSMTI